MVYSNEVKFKDYPTYKNNKDHWSVSLFSAYPGDIVLHKYCVVDQELELEVKV